MAAVSFKEKYYLWIFSHTNPEENAGGIPFMP
jgi:hypothetical protein